ncbi:MAG: DUF357 domain-containing protein [Methanomicrobiales archaeon HGW-Methanomicrobiales-1]|jgi:hypothetical protein|nr:MAG: DUF357 domain-containing protein [Methanomicrobiales archaeon HGW-Methanomicrobiales-1]
MKIAECRDALAAALSRTRITADRHTPLGHEGFAILEMAQAYRKDGTTFYRAGDIVNALAAFWYSAGWLHFGISSGYLSSDDQNPFGPFTGPLENLPLAFAEKLGEKTQRYERLLDTARSSVECAGEPATISNDFAGKVLLIAGLYASRGKGNLKAGAYEEALACFSYGHGWLDAGVTCGYFRIMAHRDIFTV